MFLKGRTQNILTALFLKGTLPKGNRSSIMKSQRLIHLAASKKTSQKEWSTLHASSWAGKWGGGVLYCQAFPAFPSLTKKLAAVGWLPFRQIRVLPGLNIGPGDFVHLSQQQRVHTSHLFSLLNEVFTVQDSNPTAPNDCPALSLLQYTPISVAQQCQLLEFGYQWNRSIRT